MTSLWTLICDQLCWESRRVLKANVAAIQVYRHLLFNRLSRDDDDELDVNFPLDIVPWEATDSLSISPPSPASAPCFSSSMSTWPGPTSNPFLHPSQPIRPSQRFPYSSNTPSTSFSVPSPHSLSTWPSVGWPSFGSLVLQQRMSIAMKTAPTPILTVTPSLHFQHRRRSQLPIPSRLLCSLAPACPYSPSWWLSGSMVIHQKPPVLPQLRNLLSTAPAWNTYSASSPRKAEVLIGCGEALHGLLQSRIWRHWGYYWAAGIWQLWAW